MFDTETCDKMKCLKQTKIFLAFWAPCISKTVRDRKNWLNNSESSYREESNKKIPSKLDEKWKFYAAPKIAFLAFWAPCISKTVRDRKNWLQRVWKISFRGMQWKKSHQNRIKNKTLMWLQKSHFCPFLPAHWEEFNEKNPIKIGWKINWGASQAQHDTTAACCQQKSRNKYTSSTC